ncbi:restriction endonuclease subunit S [Acinetobacter pittii]|uniref:restriction endonuclease subunit S n=2 Tax=Acinetobacter calcoaceticus/baumannii complex TaxID=909768 RepID=UPI0024DE8B69|nr:restriction endonuclease subunit S [Acinetobacter pittii]
MDQKVIPQGWTFSTLGEVVNVIRGVTYNKEQSSSLNAPGLLPVIRANNIQSGQLVFDDLVYVQESLVKHNQLIRAGDIVVAMSSGSKSVVGKTANAKQDYEAGFGAFCGILRPNQLINSNYVSWFTFSAEYRNKVSSLSAGANINNLKPSSFDEVRFPIPALAEQQAIVDKLDTLLAQVESIKVRLERIPKLLKQFRQSVLAAAVTGKLMECNEEVVYKTLAEVGIQIKTGPFGSALHKSDYIEDGIPVINPMHINNGVISPSKSMTISKEKFIELDVWKLRDEDIVLGRRGEMGRAAIVKTNGEDLLCGTGSMIVRVDNNNSPKYMEFVLRSPVAVNYFNSSSVGTTMVNLNQKIIKEFEVFLPSLQTQLSIVELVENHIEKSFQIEQYVECALDRVNNLTQSILAKAFRGELTAEWREANPELISGENSAEALLGRIKAERELAKPATKRGRAKT